ncbi:MAG TPA: hypothetical protein VKF17_00540 [Isosphaeraceae bacterium]|nr:hypothetical protein [Isosphaeraceae bacterium]
MSRSAGPGFQTVVSARGLAVGDFDDDGDLDLLITTMDGPPLLLRNDSPRLGHWLKLRVLNRHGSPAINARAVLVAGGRSQMKRTAQRLHLPIAKRPRASFRTRRNHHDRLARNPLAGWKKNRLKDVQADQTLTIREPAEATSRPSP